MNIENKYEDQIIQDAISGDKQAFGILYERFFQQMFRYLLIRSNCEDDAEDMTEVVFLKAWLHLPEFGKRNKGANFRAWLYRIAHNTVVDYYRTYKQKQSLDPAQQSLDKGPGLLIEEKEETKKMVSAIRKLDPDSQNVIICRFVSGLNHKETALSTGLSEGNVRVIQYRALKKIKELMEAEYE